MNIVEATELAMRSGKGITRPSYIYKKKHGTYFLPTNITTLGFVIVSNNQLYMKWEPKYEDIIAKDWMVHG